MTQSTIRALVLDSSSASGFALGTRELPIAGPAECVIKVAALSLNPGEIRGRATLGRPGWYPGRDFAGIVERAAGDGSGPPVGARVVGWVISGAFAERIVAPARHLAVLPEAVSFAEAATLPVAGLTAYLALAKSSSLILGQPILINGATGGVGHFAIQLARAGGAQVTTVVRSPARAARAYELGAHKVISVAELSTLRNQFELALETVGIELIPPTMKALRNGGICISVSQHHIEGMSGHGELDVADLLARNLNLQRLYVFDELAKRNPAADLAKLVELTASGTLKPWIGYQGSWQEFDAAVDKLLNRTVLGKIVLTVD